MNVSTRREESILSSAGWDVSLRIPCKAEDDEKLGSKEESWVVRRELLEEEDMVLCLNGGLLSGGPPLGAFVFDPGILAFDEVGLRGVDSIDWPTSYGIRGESFEELKLAPDKAVEERRLPRFLPMVTSRSSERCPCSAYWGCSEGLLKADVNSSRTGNGVKFATWTDVRCLTRRYIE